MQGSVRCQRGRMRSIQLVARKGRLSSLQQWLHDKDDGSRYYRWSTNLYSGSCRAHGLRDMCRQLPDHDDHYNYHGRAIKLLRLLWRVLVLPRKQSKLLLLRPLLRRTNRHLSFWNGHTAPPTTGQWGGEGY